MNYIFSPEQDLRSSYSKINDPVWSCNVLISLCLHFYFLFLIIFFLMSWTLIVTCWRRRLTYVTEATTVHYLKLSATTIELTISVPVYATPRSLAPFWHKVFLSSGMEIVSHIPIPYVCLGYFLPITFHMKRQILKRWFLQASLTPWVYINPYFSYHF